MSSDTPSTADRAYAERLVRLQNVWWKRVLNVQLPWQLHLRSLKLGATVDVGCGIGRNLKSLGDGSVGVDHNPYCVAAARDAGGTAATVDEFFADPDLTRPGRFDALLSAHVIEHLTPADARDIMGSYLPFLRPGARVVWICPQERGYASDATHITFTDFDALRELADDLGLVVDRQYSFPFPRWMGGAFIYNEFVTLAHVPD